MSARKSSRQKAADAVMRVYWETREAKQPDRVLLDVARLLKLKDKELNRLLAPARKRFSARNVMVKPIRRAAHRPEVAADRTVLIEAARVIIRDYATRHGCSYQSARKAILHDSSDIMPLRTAIRIAKAQATSEGTTKDNNLAYKKLKPNLRHYVRLAKKK